MPSTRPSVAEGAAFVSNDQRIVMLCTAARGGMRAVVEGYERDGLFERCNVTWLITHDEGSVWRRARLAMQAWLAFLALLLRGRVALVHSHMAMRGSFWRKSLFNATARLFSVPVVAHLHGSEFRQFYASLSPRGKRRVESEFVSCARVLVLSEAWRAFIVSIAPNARVETLPNYVVVPPVDTTGSSLGRTGTVEGLFLGVIGERKGVFDLLPAMAAAGPKAPSLHLMVCGNGDVARAQVEAERLRISDRVSLPGWVTGDRKVSMLTRANFYVLPSHNEGLPMSLLEAMAQGLPVIATRVGGIPELVRDGIDGILIDAGDRDALASALIRMGNDDAWRAEAGVAARERVKSSFSREAVLPRLEAIYASLRSRGARRPPRHP